MLTNVRRAARTEWQLRPHSTQGAATLTARDVSTSRHHNEWWASTAVCRCKLTTALQLYFWQPPRYLTTKTYHFLCKNVPTTQSCEFRATDPVPGRVEEFCGYIHHPLLHFSIIFWYKFWETFCLRMRESEGYCLPYSSLYQLIKWPCSHILVQFFIRYLLDWTDNCFLFYVGRYLCLYLR